MIFNFSKIFIKDAFAHCDIPCGIYDPHQAQLAAHTVIRMTQLLKDVKREDPSVNSGLSETTAEHDIARMTRVKEEHGEIVENELGTLENDYFKEEHFKEYPQLKELIAEAVKLSIKTRQHIDIEASLELLEKVMQVAEIFYKTKNVVPVRIKSLYPTEGELVIYK